MEAAKTVKLNNGLIMPMIGMGTYLGTSSKKDVIIPLLKKAVIEGGVRLIDTAKVYGYEEELGIALEDIFKDPKANIKRQDLFIVNKLWNDAHDNVEQAIMESLKKMKLEYFDLYLVHWPVNECLDQGKLIFKKVPLYKTWKGMEDIYKKGLAKSIGVSNFNCQILLDLFTYAEVIPAVNQIELHPYLPQTNLVNYCKKVGIQPMAFAPLSAPGSTKPGTSAIIDPVVTNLAKKYSKSPAQICLAWGMARGHVVVSASSSLERIKENLAATNFVLKEEDVEALSNLQKKLRIYDPAIGTFHPWGHIPVFE